MILRRVIAHVRQQEWTAIWIDPETIDATAAALCEALEGLPIPAESAP